MPKPEPGSSEQVCPPDSERANGDERLRARAILDHMPADIWTIDPDLRITSSFGGGLRSLGFSPDQFVGVSLISYLSDHPRRDEFVAVHRRAIAGETLVFETEFKERDLIVRIEPLRDAAGAINGAIGVGLDVTDQKRAEKRYRELFERNLAGVFRSTVSGRLLEGNDAFVKMFGYSTIREMTDGVPSTVQLYWNPADRDEVVSSLRARGELRNFELRLRTRHGQMVWGLLNEAIIQSADGDDILEGTMIDISARKIAEEQIEYQTFHDSLTGLPNRFLFNDRLGVSLAHARRHGRAVAVMFLDLDHFKLINDTMAHTAGDDLLRRVADRISRCIRPDDTVARAGGDEFIFLLSDIHQGAAAATVAQKIMDAIRQPFVIHGRELYVTGSIGIAVAPHDGEDAETLVKNADSAMFRAKDAGRNNFQFHTPAAQQRAEMRLTLETALRHALDRNEFFLVYQPQVELATGRITGFEALLRWARPLVGTVGPTEFIPLAEESGSIVAIGEWVLRTACAQLREWQRRRPGLRMAINISPRQFQHENLMRLVEQTVEENELDPATVEFEVTETLSMGDSDLTIGRLSHLRSLGFRVALDDFGTGYSSLGRLRFMPIDSLKIDRTFVTDLRMDSPDRRIVQAIVTMAQSLDLRVIAEGVETEDQRSILHSLGCDEMQGFVFSQALPSEEAERLLV